jgi:translocator protein
MREPMKRILELMICIVICVGLSFIGQTFPTPNFVDWYDAIMTTSFNRPNWEFALYWTIIFMLVGIALFLIWDKRKGKDVRKSLRAFSMQFILTICSSIAFFQIHSALLGFIIIGILWFFIIRTIILFWKISVVASILLVPYLIWVSYAIVLSQLVLFMRCISFG